MRAVESRKRAAGGRLASPAWVEEGANGELGGLSPEKSGRKMVRPQCQIPSGNIRQAQAVADNLRPPGRHGVNREP